MRTAVQSLLPSIPHPSKNGKGFGSGGKAGYRGIDGEVYGKCGKDRDRTEVVTLSFVFVILGKILEPFAERIDIPILS